MTKPLNFNNSRKKYLTVILNDEKNTTLLVGTPTKAIMNELIALQKEINSMGDGEVDMESLELLYELSATLMSRNKTNTKVTKEQLENTLDLEDIFTFFTAYMEFIEDVSKGKN